jgi:hypothetical protein
MPFVRWLKAVSHYWKQELVGGFLIGALALYSDLSGVAVSPRVYEASAVILIFYAMFLAWNEQSKKTEAIDARIKELQAEKPQFLSSLAASLGSVGSHVQVLTDLTVYNHGNKSSILKNWGFKYSDLIGGKEHRILQMAVNLAFTPAGIKQMGDPISTDSGIPPGGERTYRRSYPLGWSLEDISNNGLKITITFADIDDRPYSASAEFPSRRKIS